MSQNCTKTAG